MESKITYFESLKPGNTDTAFSLVKERLQGSGIKKIVLASTTGATALKAMDFFKDMDVKLVVVAHQFDYNRRKQHFFPQETVKILREAGHEVYFGTMLFHTEHLYGTQTPTIIANLLRTFCQGVKVCFEIVIMATDAGHLTVGERVIAMAGTARGVDTALVMQAGSSQYMMNLRVHEILCKLLNPLYTEELRERLGAKDMDELKAKLAEGIEIKL